MESVFKKEVGEAVKAYLEENKEDVARIIAAHLEE